MIGEWTAHLWQSTLFAAAIALLTLAFRKNRAQVRYWLWVGASFKFLVPFSLLMSLGSHLQWVAPARTIAAPAVSLAIDQVIRPFPGMVPFAPSTSGGRDWVAIAIVAAWICGFAAVALIRLRGWLRIRAAVRSSTPIDIQMPATVEIRSAPGLLEPGVAGLFRPVLLLPAGITERLTRPQLESVLAHELYHVRRRDNLLAAIHMIVETMFWFYPLVWWIGARLVEERERACDEGVLSLGSEPHVYAEAILNVCKLYVESPLACVAGVTGADLKRRIEAIMSNRIIDRLSVAKKAALVAAGMVAVSAPVVVGIVRGQSAAAAVPKFEVASVKRCKVEAGSMIGGGADMSPGRLSTGCIALAEPDHLGLIHRAYVRFADGRFHSMMIVPITGGPGWIRSERFDINAKAEGTPSREVMQGPMLQALLEDRFKLKIHRETREVQVYTLSAAKGGPKLQRFQEGSCVPMPSWYPLPPLGQGQQYCMNRISLRKPAVDAQGSTLDEFSKLLSIVFDRPVIDATGMEGRFDIHLEFTADESTPKLMPRGDVAAAAPDPTGQPIFAAIQQQLGLKLVAGKGPGEFLVIDHVERPSEN